MFEFLSDLPIIGSFLTLVLPFLIVITIVVAVHEYGHYRIGRACGIHAEVFSIGFGPILASRVDQRGTQWQIAAIPLGGYVRFLGDADPSSSGQNHNLNAEDRARSLGGAALHKRALTVLAGPVANFILSIVLFTGLSLYVGKASEQPIIGAVNPSIAVVYDLQPGDLVVEIDGKEIEDFGDLAAFLSYEEVPSEVAYLVEREGVMRRIAGPFPYLPIVGNVMPVSPAAKAGLQENDVIRSYQGVPVSSFTELREAIFGSGEEVYPIEVLRNGEVLTLEIQPRRRDIPDGEGGFTQEVSIGVVAGTPFDAAIENPGIFTAIYDGLWRTWFVIDQSIEGVSLIISGEIGAENLQGPLGIAHVSADVAKSGLVDLISLIAFISTAIGFLNLLPLPVLDGGHLMFYLYEAVTGRKPSEKVQGYSTAIALALLLSLMLFVTFNDVIRLALYWA